MGTITDLYVAGKIGYAAGEHFAERLQSSAQNAQALYYSAADINNIRSAIYQKKKELVASSVTQDILNAIFTDPVIRLKKYCFVPRVLLFLPSKQICVLIILRAFWHIFRNFQYRMKWVRLCA